MTKYGRYEVRKKLGGGGMGVVFLAYDPRLGREVAIKVIGAFVSDKDKSRQRFNREAQVMAGLSHAAIVPIYDFGEQDGQPYLVMRLMQGGSLGELMYQKGRFTLAEATQLFSRLAPALDMAHARGMVHRDLKPDNILLDQFGHPAITDFGLVKLLNASMPTKTGRIMGTPHCMSPEQGRGESDVDHKTDIYALGIILFKLLTNEWPYESGIPLGFIYLHNYQPIPNICDLNPDLPAECQTVIECALAKERDDRYESVREFVEALKALQAPKRPVVQRISAVDYLKRGHAAYNQKNYELAIIEYNEALRLRPAYTNAYMSRGNAYYWSGEYGLAIDDYNQTLQIKPNYAAAYYWRGRAKQEQGKQPDAIADYEEALRINPNSLGAYYQRGLVRQEMGQLDLALADYEAALRIHPKHAKAKTAQQAVLQQIKEAQEREEERQREAERLRKEEEARQQAEAEHKRRQAEARQREIERQRKEAEAATDVETEPSWLASESQKESTDYPDWLSQPDTPSAVEEVSKQLPDWLKEEQIATSAQPTKAPQWSDEGKTEDTSASSDLPDWLNEQTGPAPQESGNLPDWLSGKNVPEAPSHNLPDWLNKGQTRDTSAVSASIDEQLPDWLKDDPVAAPAVSTSIDQELPDWLKDDPVAPAVSASIDQELPDWLKDDHVAAPAVAEKSHAKREEERMKALLNDDSALKKLPKADQINVYVNLLRNESLQQAIPAQRRAQIGIELAKLGDPRPEVMSIDGMEFCYVPPGPFWMGSNDQGNDNNKPLHQVDIPYGYWIGRYPVTNAQYQAFVDDGGYRNPVFWAEAKAQGYWKDGKTKDWGNWRDAPYDYRTPVTLPNHPRVGITWYEALAFTRWLSQRWHGTRLPSEAEWEKAARGGLSIPVTPLIRPAISLAPLESIPLTRNPLPQRSYPWGNDFDANLTNSEETGIKHSNAVGVFSMTKSPYGAQEMSGNVWEYRCVPDRERSPSPLQTMLIR